MFIKGFARKLFLASTLLGGALATGVSQADDIDIICSQEINSESILFLLDDSGSMRNNTLSGNQGVSREEALRRVFREYMTEREGGEVGMMLFRNARNGGVSQGGGFVVYPVENINSVPYTAPGRQGPVRNTVRDELIHQMENNVGGGGTPIVDVLYEAVVYLMGGQVDFGRHRQGYANDRLSHPASYENGVSSQPECWDSGADSCANEVIVGNANYISPFSTSMNAGGDAVVNIVLLSDGQPTVHRSETQIGNLIGNQYFGQF